jgi:hypothetical protein
MGEKPDDFDLNAIRDEVAQTQPTDKLDFHHDTNTPPPGVTAEEDERERALHERLQQEHDAAVARGEKVDPGLDALRQAAKTLREQENQGKEETESK